MTYQLLHNTGPHTSVAVSYNLQARCQQVAARWEEGLPQTHSPGSLRRVASSCLPQGKPALCSPCVSEPVLLCITWRKRHLPAVKIQADGWKLLAQTRHIVDIQAM